MKFSFLFFLTHLIGTIFFGIIGFGIGADYLYGSLGYNILIFDLRGYESVGMLCAFLGASFGATLISFLFQKTLQNNFRFIKILFFLMILSIFFQTILFEVTGPGYMDLPLLIFPAFFIPVSLKFILKKNP